MTKVQLVQAHTSYREVEGYAQAAKNTYSKTKQAYELDVTLTEIQGEIVYKTIVTVFYGTEEKGKL